MNLLLTNHSLLLKHFPLLYEQWKIRFPFEDDNDTTLELTRIFINSSSYKQFDNHLETSFQEFCNKFWHLVTDRLPHLNKENFSEVKSYHVHYYAETELNLKGPHTKDMKWEQFTNSELQSMLSHLKVSVNDYEAILVHTSTNDDLYDHIYGALWLGKTLPLHFDRLN